MFRSKGFTLIEILVALSVFAVMSVLTYGGMNRVLDYYEQVQVKTNELQQLQMVFSTIKNDLEQSVDRPIRDNLGSKRPGFFSNPNDDIRLAITTNLGSPFQLKPSQSSLQRIEYRLEENNLIRDVWPVLDRAHNTEPISQVLLQGIEGIEFTFINNQEHEFWPLPNGHQDYRVLPRAVKVILEMESKQIERLFLVSSV